MSLFRASVSQSRGLGPWTHLNIMESRILEVGGLIESVGEYQSETRESVCFTGPH